MTAATLVTSARDGAVQVLRLNRPAARNALNAALLGELRQALAAAAADPAVRAVLLAAEGPVFCAGGDLKEIFAEATPMTIHRFLDEQIRPVLRALIHLDKPVVAALQGPVAGAGIGLALAADIIVAGEGASFVPAFGKVGAMPDSATLYLMNQYLGPLRTRDIVFRNRSLAAAEAAALGLYSQVVADGELAATAAAIAAEVAAGPTVALGLAKRALREAVRLPFDAFMDLESLSMALINSTADQQEGIAAFHGKRAPRFLGR